MIRIPNLPQAAGQPVNSPNLSAAAANAPNEALGNVARAIGGISEAFQAHADQIQRVENARMDSEARNRFAAEYADLQLAIEKEMDPAKRIEMGNAFFQKTAGMADDPALPPAVRDSLREFHSREAERGTFEIARSAARLTVDRAKAAFENEFSRAVETGDEAAGLAAVDRLAASGAALPEEAEGMRRKLSLAVRDRNMVMEIQQDAAGWLERNPADKMPDGYDPIAWAKKREYAKELMRGQTIEDVDGLTDGIISGQITTAEDLEKKAGHLRPAVRARLQGLLREQAVEGERARLASPEYQREVAGKVSSLLTDYEPAADDFDWKFVEMAGLVKSLPPGALKDELSRRINQVREGKLGEVKTHAEAAMKALDEAAKAGRFGTIPEPKPVPLESALADGFLMDRRKLRRLGFAEDQADEIAEAAAGDMAAGQKAFADLWGKREGGSVYASEIEIAMADAVRLGKANAPWNDPESEDAVITAKLERERRHGAAIAEMSEWLKLNPKATREEIEGKILDIAGKETLRALKGIYDPKPGSGGPKGAADGTAAVPVGKTLTEIVKNFEAGGAPGGFHREAYWDYGQWSIGYGTKSKQGETISEAEAANRLAAELGEARGQVEAEAKKAGITLKPHELDALTSFQFNTGRVSSLLAGGARSKAEIAETMLLYRNAGGRRLRGLERRRAAERTLFLNGYPS